MNTAIVISEDSKSRGQWSSWILLLILALGAWLRFEGLGLKSLWVDEYLSIADSRSLGVALRKLFHPPLYFSLLHYWRKLFGSSEWAVRSLSSTFGTANILLVYAIAIRLKASSRVALSSAALVAVLPVCIFFSREARMYTLWATLVLLSFWALLGMIQGKRGSSVLYGLFVLLGLLTHYYMVFFIFALGICCFLGPLSRRPLWKLTFLKAHTPLLLLPLFVAVVCWARSIHPIHYLLRQLRLLGERDSGGLWDFVYKLDLSFWYHNFYQKDFGWAVLVVMGWVIWGLVVYRKDNQRTKVGVGLLAIVVFLPLLLISLPFFPSQDLRYVFPVYPLLCILVCISAGELLHWERPAHLRGIAVGLVFLSGLVFTSRLPLSFQKIYETPKEDWRGVSEFVQSEGSSSEAVLVYAPFFMGVFKYYYRGKAPVVGVPYPEYTQRDEWVGFFGDVARRYERVWLVYAHEGDHDPLGEVPGRLGLCYPVTELREFRNVRVYFFSRDGARLLAGF